MDFTELEIKRSYISRGGNSISNAFLVPALKCANAYMRSVGYFSSNALIKIMDGIVSLSRRNGQIRLVASPQLSQEDIDAISLGYQQREELIRGAFDRTFLEEIKKIDDANLQTLATLIARGILDIKIAVTDGVGEYHDKLGLLEDIKGNRIAFFGSSNSSLNGYQNNYEKIRVARSWVAGEDAVVADEMDEFSSLWNDTNPFVKVLNYKESARDNILKVIQGRSASTLGPEPQPIKLRDYQLLAIKAWEENDFHGFYVMATGTGKTWTAIYSAKALLKKTPATIVICAPYKHLVKQWSEDVTAAFPDAKVILVSSENPVWSQQINQALIKKKYNKNTQIIIITTIASFNMQRFSNIIEKDPGEKLLIVDEAHRFTNRPESLLSTYNYMLGLSATPFSGASAEKGRELMAFFGGQVFSLPIEDALDRGYLVPYYYHPIFVEATEDEEQRFQSYTHKILSCFNKAGQCINPDLLVKSLRNRLRVISMASEKQRRIDEFISQINEADHFVVYCGDGRLFDNNTGEEIRHIQSIKRVLFSHDIKASQFTATESMEERMTLVDAFNKGEISALAAIRCLDEGINIPSIKSALILSSNDDYREFVQRRGRILRTYKGKEYATIYDIVVLPSWNTPGMAKIELRRFREYARLALNWAELEPKLEELLDSYHLSLQDVDVYDYEGMEEQIDE